MGGHKKTALLVGCNYPNTEYELHGCINDVISMQETLKGRFGFDPNHIELLTDSPGSKAMPTGANIKAALSRHIEQAEPGDLVFFHYSGHGTWFPPKHHDYHHKRDEAIVPCDFNLITDVDFRALVNKLSKEATFTFISDSCHSGGLIDKEKEQIGPDFKASPPHQNNHYQSKHIPIESIHSHLSTLSGVISEEAGPLLIACFKDNASLKFRPSDVALNTSEVAHSDSVILLSGCQANETSADMPGQGGSNAQPHGAFSDAVQRVLRESAAPVTNKELVLKARTVLKGEGVDDQHPCLYCSDADVVAPFLLELRPKDV